MNGVFRVFVVFRQISGVPRGGGSLGHSTPSIHPDISTSSSSPAVRFHAHVHLTCPLRTYYVLSLTMSSLYSGNQSTSIEQNDGKAMQKSEKMAATILAAPHKTRS